MASSAVPLIRGASSLVLLTLLTAGCQDTTTGPARTREMLEPLQDISPAAVATGYWIDRAPMPLEKWGIAAGVLSGKIYVLGGTGAQDLLVYAPTTDRWSVGSRAPLPTGAPNGIEGVNGILYVIGGAAGESWGIVQAYNPVTNSWTRKADVPNHGGCGATATMNGLIYVMTGCTVGGAPYQTQLFRYNPATNAWETLPAPPHNHTLGGLAVAGVGIYAVGGLDSAGAAASNALDVYLPSTNAWRPRPPMPTARAYVQAERYGTGIYVMGGSVDATGGTGSNTVEMFDVVTWTWSTSAPMLHERASFAAAAVGNNSIIYAMGGSPGSPSTEAYHPMFTCDVHEPNDVPARATPLAIGSELTDSKICAVADSDFISLTVPSRQVLFLQVAPPTGKNFDIELRDAAGAVVARGQNPGDLPETIVYDAQPGTYYLLVRGVGAFDADHPYTVTWPSGLFSFPLGNRGADSAAESGAGATVVRIRSVFDHSYRSWLLGAYCPDAKVLAYTGELGTVQASVSTTAVCKNNGVSYNLMSYRAPGAQAIQINGNYAPADPTELTYDGHPGFDFSTTDPDQAPADGRVPVFAAAAGKVICLFTDPTHLCGDTYYPSAIGIDHGNGYRTYYLHLYAAQVTFGASVRRGQRIGTAGSNGVAAPQLHFQVERNSAACVTCFQPVDPYGWAPIAGAPVTIDPYTWRVSLRLWRGGHTAFAAQ